MCSLTNLNYAKWTNERVQRCLAAGRLHLHVVIALCHVLAGAGLRVPHEHPQSATFWHDPWVERLHEHPRVSTTVCNQCQYGLRTTGKGGEAAPTKKPTRIASSSPHMLARLSKRCDHRHTHEYLLGGRAIAAAFYPAM